MSDPLSPLQAIYQKETELRRRLEMARQQAEASLQSARAEAERRLAQADQEGRADAKALFDQGLAEVRQEAEAVLAGAQAQAAALQNRAATHLDAAARQIVPLVLPGTSRLA